MWCKTVSTVPTFQYKGKIKIKISCDTDQEGPKYIKVKITVIIESCEI